jgi:hypothetical protein
MALFDSRNFSWSELEVAVNGRIVTGIRGVSYDVEQDKEHIYGKGSSPQGIGRGNRKPMGEIRLLGGELSKLIASSPLGDLLRLRCEITVVYADALGIITKDILTGVEFTKVSRSLSQGDMFMEVNLPIIMLDIKYNV